MTFIKIRKDENENFMWDLNSLLLKKFYKIIGLKVCSWMNNISVQALLSQTPILVLISPY
jgi:hypothetical protein